MYKKPLKKDFLVVCFIMGLAVGVLMCKEEINYE